MDAEESRAFGALLKRYRLAAGLTQETLAEQAGLSIRGVSDLERGARRAPRLETVRLLAGALRLSARERALFLAAARPADQRGVATTGREAHDEAAAPDAELAASSEGTSVPAGVLTPFAGRLPELALLLRHLGGAGPPALLLAGEPGIGKTRLLQEAARQAVARGLTVLTGGCQRQGGQQPYAPLLDALDHHIQSQPALRLRDDLRGCAWLVRLLPELADGPIEPLPAGALPPEQERRLLFGAVRRFLQNVAGPAGTLLLLDDLQWAGDDALALLATLVRAAGSIPLRVVGAYRDTEVDLDQPLGVLLADLAQARLAAQHSLGPLTQVEAAQLLDALLADLHDPEGRLHERVLLRADGMPFFLISCVQGLRAQGTAQGSAVVPWDVAAGVRQRMAALPEAARALLGVAAVVGRTARLGVLAAVVARPEEEVLAGLAAACRARLLLEEGGAAYTFAHDVIREVVEADLGAARQAVLHRKVAEALEGDTAGTSAETLSYHYKCGGNPDKAVLYLERAGDHAWVQHAHAAAEGHFREVLARLEGLGRAQDAPRVREKLAEVLYRAGHYDAAIQVLEPAAEALRAAGDWAGLGRVTMWIGRAHFRRGTPHEGMARLTALLELMERSGASPPPAALYAGLGQLLFTTGQYGESLAASERAAELARAGGDERTGLLATLLASWNRVHLAQMQGRLGEALRLGEEVVLPLLEALGEPEGLLMVHRDLAYGHALWGAVATGQGHLARALALAEQLGDPEQLAFTLALHGWLAFLSGDWPGAGADLDRALALSRQVDRSVLAVFPLILRARLSLTADDQATASTSAQEALALAEGHDNLGALQWAAAVVAEIDVLEGRPAVASARLLPLLDGPGLQDPDVTALLPVLAWAYLEQRLVEQAAGIVEQALARARPEGMRLVLVEALRVAALIAICQGRWAAAERSLEEGLALARSMPYPYAEARLLAVDGRRHAAQGKSDAARERLEAALAIFSRLGARADVALTEQAFTTLPSAPPRAAAMHLISPLPAGRDGGVDAPAGKRLTRAERQAWAVARLCVEGSLSPRAYARDLGVSVDTALLDLRELVDRGLVRAEGTTKDRRYVLVGDARRAGDSPNASRLPQAFGESP